MPSDAAAVLQRPPLVALSHQTEATHKKRNGIRRVSKTEKSASTHASAAAAAGAGADACAPRH
jgi:hypothetical protein